MIAVVPSIHLKEIILVRQIHLGIKTKKSHTQICACWKSTENKNEPEKCEYKKGELE